MFCIMVPFWILIEEFLILDMIMKIKLDSKF